MRVIAIANGAGSAGKSATAAALAALEAETGRRVLVIDTDGQATVTNWLGAEPSHDTIARVFDRTAILTELAVATPIPGIEVIPASDMLDEAMARITGPGLELRLKTAIRRAEGRWDTIIIDCPGSIGLVTIAALVAASDVVSVTVPTLKEIRGIGRLNAAIADVAEALNPDCRLTGIVPCVVPSNAGNVYKEAMGLLRETYGEIVTRDVRRTARVPESFHEGQPVTLWAPKAPIADDYRAVHKTLLNTGASGRASLAKEYS